MWLDVEEDDELKGAARIKVTVSEVIEKRGKKKRTRYQCKVILYGASDEEVGGFERFDHRSTMTRGAPLTRREP